MRFRALAALAGVCAPAFWLGAQEPPEYEKPKIRMARITSPIKVDGDLSDPGWAEATVVPLAYEINPGDNTTPAVKTTARIGYDDKFFYVSFECRGPGHLEAPSSLRRPRRDQRRPGLRRDPPRRREPEPLRDRLLDRADRHPGGLRLFRGDVHRGLRAGLLLAVRRMDRSLLLERRGGDPPVVPALSREGSAGLGASRSTARFRAIGTISSTACAFRAARAAFSATRRPSRASPASRRARTGCSLPTAR